MPSVFKVLSLLALALAVFSGALASPHPRTRVVRKFSDCSKAVGHEVYSEHKSRSNSEGLSRERDMTNAERLEHHLPLKPPTRRSSGRSSVSSPAPMPSSRGYM
ncbi:hypothetical protein GGX14DRAFT_668199 [Mycena pura]|uniref:Uncharacterized protein n=1 Tax=Mycena pura TaxID=153505 RepID=A0AAD6UXZ3_9AGAR|nr:hypothetical protein GGX14DRAFT_668199 [Mycena pura]